MQLVKCPTHTYMYKETSTFLYHTNACLVLHEASAAVQKISACDCLFFQWCYGNSFFKHTMYIQHTIYVNVPMHCMCKTSMYTVVLSFPHELRCLAGFVVELANRLVVVILNSVQASCVFIESTNVSISSVFNCSIATDFKTEPSLL